MSNQEHLRSSESAKLFDYLQPQSRIAALNLRKDFALQSLRDLSCNIDTYTFRYL